MRILGLDLGTRTLGMALSDETLTIASAYQTIRFDDSCYDMLLDPILKVVQEYDVHKIVLGFPKNMNNTVGERGIVTQDFQRKLESFLNIEVVLQDERLSTVEATHYMVCADVSRKKRKKKIDGLAASIILQTYLDRMKG